MVSNYSNNNKQAISFFLLFLMLTLVTQMLLTIYISPATVEGSVEPVKSKTSLLSWFLLLLLLLSMFLTWFQSCSHCYCCYCSVWQICNKNKHFIKLIAFEVVQPQGIGNSSKTNATFSKQVTSTRANNKKYTHSFKGFQFPF